MRASAWLAAAALASLPAAAGAQGVVSDGVAEVESRVDAAQRVADRWLDAAGPLGELVRRVHVGGYASYVYFDAQRDAQVGDPEYDLWDARLFLDVDLAREVELGGATWLRGAGVSVEWNVYRVGTREDDLGEAYLELQGLGDSSLAEPPGGALPDPGRRELPALRRRARRTTRSSRTPSAGPGGGTRA